MVTQVDDVLPRGALGAAAAVLHAKDDPGAADAVDVDLGERGGPQRVHPLPHDGITRDGERLDRLVQRTRADDRENSNTLAPKEPRDRARHRIGM